MFTISSERGPEFLRIVVTGRAAVDETCAAAAFCAELLRRTGSRRILVDLMRFAPEFARADGLEVLSTLYGGMPRLERLAVAIPAGKSHGLLLEVARHRNVPAREFDDAAEAEAWLREGACLEDERSRATAPASSGVAARSANAPHRGPIQQQEDEQVGHAAE